MPACPRCGATLHERGRPCPECHSENAWAEYREKPLVIDRAAVEKTEARLASEGSGGVRPATLVVAGLCVAALGLGVFAVARGVPLLRRWEIGPLEGLREGILVAARQAAQAGVAAFVLALAGLIALRRSRLFRSWALSAVASIGLIAGCAAGIVGGWYWMAASAGLGWEHVSVPVLVDAPPGPEGDVTRATAVVVAPDAEGDARGLGLGTGIIIRSDADRAWIATNSHVAMPYVSASAPRSAAEAHPVWVYLSDGRNAKGRVVWVARPPLDIVVVTVDLPDPPEAIPVQVTADSVAEGDSVFFVPNPLRHGWLVHRGRVLHREPHRTPAGEFSLVFTDLPVVPGDSGSGLFLADGRLVGLNTWRRETRGAPVAIGLPSDGLREMLLILDTADPDRLLEEESRR